MNEPHEEGGEEERNRELVLQKFRKLLNEFKLPLLSHLDEKGEDTDTTQHLERINEVLDDINQLFRILHDAMMEGGVNKRGDTPAKSVCAVFEKEGVLPAYRNDPKIRESLKHYLNLDLQVYPLTVHPNHIQQFEKTKIPSHQSEIIPNEEQNAGAQL